MRALLLVLLLPLLAACSAADVSDEVTPPPAEGPPPANAELEFDATVTYVTIEGGAYVLRDGEGELYEPINLDASFHEEGLAVRVWADEREDLGSYLMVGPIIEIQEIRRR